MFRQRKQAGPGFIHSGVGVGILAEKFEDLRPNTDALVQLLIRALHVRPQLDQVGRLLIHRQGFANALRGLGFLFGDHSIGEAAYRVEYIDGRIVSGGRQVARQNQMPIQDAASRVANRLIEIVAFHQHGEEARDRSFVEIARALENLGQQGEHGGV